MHDITEIGSKSVAPRIVLAAAVLVSVIATVFAVRWQLGSMLADLTPATDPNASEIAVIASDWSPSDPSTSWLRASASSDPGQAIIDFETAARLSPNDYRWRIELGRALEQEDQLERAEGQLKKAVELAPAYAYPHWHLGNFYLRRQRIDEAVQELKKAAENNHTYRDQVFSIAWDYFEKDAAQLEALAGNTPEARAHLAYFFAARGRAADALRNWDLLSEEEKARRFEVARNIAHGLFIQRAFPQALEFSRQLGFDEGAKPESVTNPSFEKGVDGAGDSRFGWVLVRNDPRVEFVTDTRVRREGTRSLRVTFKGNIKPGMANILQAVVVDPGRRYRVRFWVRTENLKSGGLPMLQIVNANDDKVIGQSQPYAAGTTDWQELSVEFTSPENCNGISIRTVRGFCGEDCPITGTFWYDDFEVSRS